MLQAALYLPASAEKGGAIYNEKGTVRVAGSTISGNTALYGGGISSYASLDVTKSTVSKNSAINGGGLFLNGNANITGSTITGNTASNSGGGIFAGTVGTEAARIVSINLTDSTVSKNTAACNGGGIYNIYDLIVGGSSQISGNTATSGYGGGIYVTAFSSSGNTSLTLSGTKLQVKSNKAAMPPSAGSWYQGYGVYSTAKPMTGGGFNDAKQVTGNSRT